MASSGADQAVIGRAKEPSPLTERRSINPDPPSGILAIVYLNFCVKPFLLGALRVVAAKPLEPPHSSAQPQQLCITAAQRHYI
jgi:hypothetical protein